MIRMGKAAAAVAMCAAAGAGLVGCGAPAQGAPESLQSALEDVEKSVEAATFTGTKKIEVDGQAVNVSCSGVMAFGKPVVILMHGGGDDLKKMSGIQETLGKKERVCSYDRLGAGGSDKPDGPQSLDSTGAVLTGVIDKVAGDTPVVLAGHSLGGVIAARYAPDHQDTVAGLVLMDATSPTQGADLTEAIPESATGPAAQLREQTLAVLAGGGPEKLTVPDGEVRSAGDIPVEVIEHGGPYLEQIPEYGPDLQQAWAEGQRTWLEVSTDSSLSTAEKSGHHIYLDQPDLVVQKIRDVVSRAHDLMPESN